MHASGVDGGRFVEIAQYVAPWIDMSEPGMCVAFLQRKTTLVTGKLSRNDLYFDTVHAVKNALQQCGNPEGKGVFWYGSYFSERCPRKLHDWEECGGYFLGHNRVAGKQETPSTGFGMMTFTVSYKTDDPDLLPKRGYPDLDKILKEATGIVQRITYK
jgi:hypothetical protein